MKNAFIFLNSRIIKVIANFTKITCYLFHFFFPNKRFTLPSHAKPILNSRKKLSIPKTLWQTNYTNRVTLPVYINYLFNRLLSYDYNYCFMTTEQRSNFIKETFSIEIFKSYSRIQIGAAQADFWRLLVLYKHGGVYMDIDAHLIWPLNSIIKPNQEEVYIVIKKGEISNYFIASNKKNLNIMKMINIIMKNIQENTIKNIYILTGPGVLNEVLDIDNTNTVYYRYTCNQGNFTNDHFQYIDKPQGKWTKEQEKIDIIKKN